MALIKEAAQDGYEFAQCVIMFPFMYQTFADESDPLANDPALTQLAERWRWTAAEKGEPEAILSYVRGQDKKVRRNMIQFAASLGHLLAMAALMKSEDQMEAWFWRLSFWKQGFQE